MSKMTANILEPRKAEHLGSLLRPTELLDYASNSPDATARRQMEDLAIKEIVGDQLKIGLRAVSDGEYRRSRETLFPRPLS